MSNKWYVIHTQTGCEEKVKANIETRARMSPNPDLIAQILVPTEKVSEVKSGKKRITNRKFFPGYILVEMELTDESWYLIKETTGVSGFIGSGRRPVPLHDSEIETIVKQAHDVRNCTRITKAAIASLLTSAAGSFKTAMRTLYARALPRILPNPCTVRARVLGDWDVMTEK